MFQHENFTFLQGGRDGMSGFGQEDIWGFSHLLRTSSSVIGCKPLTASVTCQLIDVHTAHLFESAATSLTFGQFTD